MLPQDLKTKPKYLLTFTVGYKQKKNIDAAVKKVWFMCTSDHSDVPFSEFKWSFIMTEFYMQFSDDFQILLFHYDGQTTEWDEFEWSKKAIHISARKQSKWYKTHITELYFLLFECFSLSTKNMTVGGMRRDFCTRT